MDRKILALLIIAGVIVAVALLKTSQAPKIPQEELPAMRMERATNLPFPINLPEDFEISVFAKDLASPRVLAFTPGGRLLVSQPQRGTVLLLEDTDGDGRAEPQKRLLSGLDRPHGLAFFEEGENLYLYVAETNMISRWRYGRLGEEAVVGQKQKILDLPGGGQHFTRTIKFGPDGKLYVSVGSSCNVCTEEDQRRATILRANPDGSNPERFAWGLRNTVFFIFDRQGRIWGNDMGRDWLGDDLPPDELNIVNGGDYGWPYCYGKNRPDLDFSQNASNICKDSLVKTSHYDYPAHVAPLGLAFIDSPKFPKDWQGDLLVAFHGSWNRSEPIGYEVVRLKLAGDKVIGMENFISGFIADGKVLGRPVNLVFGPDGALYISDDFAGIVYRVTAK